MPSSAYCMIMSVSACENALSVCLPLSSVGHS